MRIKLNENIRKLCKEAGFTQEQLAEELGVCQRGSQMGVRQGQPGAEDAGGHIHAHRIRAQIGINPTCGFSVFGAYYPFRLFLEAW